MRIPLALVLSLASFSIAVDIQVVTAQPVADITLPNQTLVTQSGSDFTITQGTLSNLSPTGERNLFHSFSDFSISSGTVFFENNDSSVRNVIARVTGSLPSVINGKIASSGSAPDFNLFLINPNGIFFEQNARLDINGSFLATTASSLTFPNGSEFGVTPKADPLLSIDLPVTLTLGANAGQITTNQSELLVDNHTLSLVGAGISMSDGLTSSINGRSEIGSVAPNSTIGIQANPQGFTLDYSLVSSYRDITLANEAEIRSPGGDTQVRGHDITLTAGSSISSLPSTGLLPGGPNQAGGLVDIQATGTLSLSGVKTFFGVLEFPTGIYTENDGSGLDAGDVAVVARNVEILNGAVIDSSTQGAGASGSISVTAGQVLIKGQSPLGTSRSRISAVSTNLAHAPAGNIDVTASRITLRDYGSLIVDSLSFQGAGNITVTSTIVDMYNNSSISAKTQAVSGGNLTFQNQALIFMDCCDNSITASAGNTANGGNISMTFRPEGGLLYSPLPLRPTNNDVIADAILGNGGAILIRNLIALDPNRRNPITGQPDPLYFVQFGGIPSPDSDLIASSAYGVDGTVEINPLESLESDELPNEFLGDDIEQGCATGASLPQTEQRHRSSFTLIGRGGLVANPEALLSDDRIQISLSSWPSQPAESGSSAAAGSPVLNPSEPVVLPRASCSSPSHPGNAEQ